MVNLPPIQPPGPATTPATAASDAAKQLSQLLEVPVGQKVEALINKVTELTPAERTYLLERVKQAIREAPQPGASRALAREATLAQTSNTKLLEVVINGKTTSALTDLPVKTGQVVPIRIHPSGQLQLLRAATLQFQTQTLASLMKAHPNNPAPSGLTAPPAEPAPVNPQAAPLTIKARTELVQQGMMSALPRAQPLAQLLQLSQPAPAAAHSTSPKASTNAAMLQQPAPALGAQFTSAPANAAIKAVEQTVNLLNQVLTKAIVPERATLTPVETLKQAIASSGIFYENQLKHRSAETTQPTPLDTKQLLIQLSYQIESLRPAVQQMPAADKPLLAQLFKILSPKQPPAADVPVQKQIQQLVQQLAQGTQAALSRVQLQQLMTLGAQLAEPSTQGLVHTWHVDIPVRHFHGFGNIHLMIQEREPKQKDEESNKQRKRRQKSKWHLYMELELGPAGNLAVELNLLDKQLNAQFWADRPALRSETKEQLQSLRDNLEQQGLTVTDLRCHNRPPQPKTVKMDYSIVDIRT